MVSVLMTAYNREKYIAEAIESVQASTYTNFELIIVDDCSTDNTVEIARSYEAKDDRVKVFVNEKNLGDYPNRNKAASYAQGEYLKYLDSDDIIYPHGLEVMSRSIAQFPEAGWGLSSHPDLQVPYPVCIPPQKIYKESFGRFSHFDRAPGSAIIRRSAFNSVGGFSGKRLIGDYELWFVLGRQFPLVKFQKDLIWHRSHDGQEFRSDYASEYDSLRKGVLGVALKHPDCPLSSQEKKLIQSGLARKKRKITFLKILSKLNAFR